MLTISEPLVGRSLELLCDLSAVVSLRESQRGIHMSRMIEALPGDTTERTLLESALLVADTALNNQAQEHSRVRLATTIPVYSSTHVTGLKSPDTVQLSAFARAGSLPGGGISLSATNITACPCMQRYTLHHLSRELGLTESSAADLAHTVAIATHTQRGTVRITALAEDTTRLPTSQELYEIIVARTVLVQELLKRPDEYDVIMRSHTKAQFVEDVARDIADEINSRLGGGFHLVKNGLLFEVVVRSRESIHSHDVWAVIRIGDETMMDQLYLPNAC
jgi:GTP cyclohydrolase FolE2